MTAAHSSPTPPAPCEKPPGAAGIPPWVILGALLALLLAAPDVRAEDASGGPAAVAEMERRHQRLLKREDFTSFTDRMALLRALGRVGTPASQAALLRVVESSRRLDDEVVALLALGPALDAPQALALARFIRRRGGPERVHALGMSYARAEDPRVLAWLSGPGLECKNLDALRAVLAAQYFHADPRALGRLREVFRAAAGQRKRVDLAYAAVRAIGSVGALSGKDGPEARRFLLRAGENGDFRIRLAAADVAAQQAPLDINLRSLLRTLLGDEVAVVRQAMAAGIGEAGIEELIPELADRLGDERIKTRDIAYAALRKITKKDLGYDAGHWKSWFRNRAESEAPKKHTPYASDSSYFGVRVHSDRILFIVDLSGSMAFPWGEDTTRLDVARKELRTALEHLAPGTLFNIIAFSEKVKSWRRSEVVATPDTRKAALRWMDKVFREPRGGTYMHAALRKAFAENSRVDTIFLLTDGLATDGEPMVPEAILASVSAWNRYRRVTIHTFALTLANVKQKGVTQESGNKKDFAAVKRFLRQLANLTGGVAREIDDLPGTTPKSSK